MNVTITIPDEIADRLAVGDGDLSRRALEAFVLQEYRTGNLSKPELRRLLNFSTGYALDGFLKERGVFEPYTLDDSERERRDLQRLGF